MTAAMSGAVQAERGSRAETFLHAPAPSRPSRGRTIAATAAALALVAAVALTLSELNEGSGADAAAAYPSDALQLTFPTTAPLESILVHQGEQVRKGQLLARQATPDLSAAMALARAAVASDSARVAALQRLQTTVSGDSQTSATAAIDADLAEISAGHQLLTAAAQETAAIDAADNALAAARTSLSSADSADSAVCPGGHPTGTGASPAECATLAAEVARAEAEVATETSATVSTTARAAQLQASGERDIASGEAALSAGQGTRAGSSATTVDAELTAAQAALAVARSQLADEVQQLSNSELRAPSAGVVEGIAGAPGELAGPGGVRSGGSQLPEQSSSSFQLFPSSAGGAAGGQTASSLPVVTLRVGSGWQVIARVPQSSVTSIRRGELATFTFAPLGGAVLHCVVSGVQATPTEAGSGVDYDVVLRVIGSMPGGALPGMSGSVVFG